jgi:hypothetical protein
LADLDSPDKDERWGQLEQRAGERGSVPVIVTLEIDVVPEGDLPPEARAAQQERIAETRRALFDELAGMRVENVAEFRAVPQVAMSVGVDALVLLERSPNVRFITEDVPISPA